MIYGKDMELYAFLGQIGAIAALMITLFYLHNQNVADRRAMDVRHEEHKRASDARLENLNSKWDTTQNLWIDTQKQNQIQWFETQQQHRMQWVETQQLHQSQWVETQKEILAIMRQLDMLERGT